MSLPEESVAANTLPEVTTIPTGKKLIFTDPDTNEGGIITLENLSKQILQNLTSQTFTLDQGNLTLLQALNQLNSNTSKLYISTTKNIAAFDSKYTTTNEGLRILYGIIENAAYISFDVVWIRIQLKANTSNLFVRIVYGSSQIENWVQIK